MNVEYETLESMCELVVDCPHSTPKWTDEGFLVLRNQNIRNGVLDLSSPSFTNQEDYEGRIRRAVPQAGDIVFTREAPMGEVCMIPEGLQCCLGQRQVLLRPKKSVNGEYLFWALQSPFVQHQISWNEGTGSTVSNVRIPVLKALKIPRNGSAEAAIAKILSDIASKIENNRQTNQTLEQIAQAIFKSWFVDFEPTHAKIAALEAGGSEDDALLAAIQAIASSALFATDAADADAPTQLARLQAEHPEQYATLRATAELFPSAMQESELGEIPEGWEASTLSDFCEFQNGYAFKGKDWADSGFPVVKIGSVKPGFVDLTKVSYVSSETVAGLERFELRAGDILVGMTGYPGETGLVPNYADRVFLNQRVGRFIPNEKYLYAYIFSAVRDSEFKVFVESQAHGSAQANISGKAILQYPLISGSKNLMMRFYEVVNPQIQQMICLNAESSQLGELRDTLLPKLLSGEITLAEEVKRS